MRWSMSEWIPINAKTPVSCDILLAYIDAEVDEFHATIGKRYMDGLFRVNGVFKAPSSFNYWSPLPNLSKSQTDKTPHSAP